MNKPRAIFIQPPPPPARDWLQHSLGDCCEIIFAPSTNLSALAGLAANADIIVGQATTPDILRASHRLRLWQTPGAAVEKLDLSGLAEKSVVVCNALSHATQVAEHAIALLLSLMRKICLHDRLVRGGQWYQPGPDGDGGLRQSDALCGATVGLVGFGAINRAVAGFLSGFGVRQLVHARSRHEGVENRSLPELFAECTALVVAVPLTGQTRGLIDATLFDGGRHAPYIVNVSRAEVIDRAALRRALELRQVRGVAFDLPYEDSSRLAGLSDLTTFETAILSPHRAGTVRGASPNLDDVVYNLRAFAAGHPLRNVVDPARGY